MDEDDPRSKAASPKCKEPPAVKELPAVQQPRAVQEGDPEYSGEGQSDDVPVDVPTAKAQMIARLKHDGRRYGYPVLFNFIAEELAFNGLAGALGTTLSHVMHNVHRDERPKKKPAAALKDLFINAGLETVEHQKYGKMVRCPIYLKYMTEFSTAN